MSASRTPRDSGLTPEQFVVARRAQLARKRAEIYRRAAEESDTMEDGGYTCNIVADIGGVEESDTYADMFDPEQVWHEPQPEEKRIRVLMLCFMAAMVEAGDA